MRNYILLSAIIFSGCNQVGKIKNDKNTCDIEISHFINKQSSMDPNLFKGFILESRGQDVNGDRFLRPLSYTKRNGMRIILPSLQETANSYKPDLDDYDYYSYAFEMGVDSSNAKVFTTNKINDLVSRFQRLEVYRVHSQLRLGEFIEFELTPKCSIWFKEKDAYLNETYSILFEEAKEVKPNWFIIEKRNTKPILKEHPSNMKID